MTATVTMRKGRPADAAAFGELAIFTAPTALPELFGAGAEAFMRDIFERPGNHFSFEHSLFLDIDGETAGMTLAFDHGDKKRETLRTFRLAMRLLRLDFFRQLPAILRLERAVVQIDEGDCYLNSIALFPKYRKRGYGKVLMAAAEREAAEAGSARMVLDCDRDSHGTVKWYEGLGYSVEAEQPLRLAKSEFTFLKMVKPLEGVDRRYGRKEEGARA